MKKISFVIIIAMIISGFFGSCKEQKGDNYTVASYYFPNYHVDPGNEQHFGSGWTEWELVKNARPRFEGHAQPKVPAWAIW